MPTFSPFLMIGIGTLVIAVLTFLLSGNWEIFIAVLILSIGAAFVEFVVPEIRARNK